MRSLKIKWSKLLLQLAFRNNKGYKKKWKDKIFLINNLKVFIIVYKMTLWTNQYELIVNKNLNTPTCFLSDFTVMYK